MTVRAIRGATQVAGDDADAVRAATAELLSAVVAENALDAADVVFILFTATPDLVSAFPAAAVADSLMADVPRLCAVEMDVAGALQRVIRLVLFAEGDTPRNDARHVYLGAATALRPTPAAGD